MSTRSSRRRNLSPKDTNGFVIPVSPTYSTNVNVRKRRQKENADISLNLQGNTRSGAVLKERTDNIFNNETDGTNEIESAQVQPRKSKSERSKRAEKSSDSSETDLQNSDFDDQTRPVFKVDSDGSNDMNIALDKQLSTNRSTKRKNKKLRSENKVEEKSVNKVKEISDNNFKEHINKPSQRKSKRAMLLYNDNLNKSRDSLESFHTAAGSPDSYTVMSQSTLKNILTKQNKSSPKKNELKIPDSESKSLSTSPRNGVLNTTYEKNSDEKEFYPAQMGSSDVSSMSEEHVALNTTLEKNRPKRTRSSKSQEKQKVDRMKDIDSVPYNRTFDNIFNISPNILLNMDDSTDSRNGAERLDTVEELNKIRSNHSETPLKRDSTFIKEHSTIRPRASFTSSKKCLDISQTKINTPVQNKLSSLSEPGSTPYHLNVRSSKRIQSGNKSAALFTITKFIEKDKNSSRRRSASVDVKRMARVAFCSPAPNNLQTTLVGNKIIKSSLKGSNKSFVFEESAKPIPRKRSFTHNDADEIKKKKRKVMSDKLNESSNRLLRPKTPQGKLNTSLSKEGTPSTIKTGTVTKAQPSSRGKAPNFAALHKKQFDKMESLGESKERKERRAKQLLFPSLFDKPANVSRGATDANSKLSSTEDAKKSVKPFTLKDFKITNSKYNRFGFKLINTDSNCFSVAKSAPANVRLNSTVNGKVYGGANGKLNETLAGNLNLTVAGKLNMTVTSKFNATVNKPKIRGAKETLMRENTSIVQKKKSENRNAIKGVRMNRRFELQMKMRNINMDS